MRTWADVWDPTYTTKLGEGPIQVVSAGISQKLDQTGDGSIEVVPTDVRALSLIDSKRVVEVWSHETGFAKRKLGVFVVESEDKSDQARSSSFSISGRSEMVALANKITLPGLAFNNVSVSQVIGDLAALAGWTANVDASMDTQYISVPFNGENILRALQVVAETQGIHIRQSATVSKQIDAGPMGSGSGIEIEYVEGDGGEILRQSDTPQLIERASIVRESADIFNWALGFGGGEGDAAISLGLSDRPFIDSVIANGRTHYIIKDNASIALYGQIERRVSAKRIVPVDSTDSGLLYAANATADAIKAKLDRYAYPQEVLKISIRNARKAIQTGDKIHITYQGMINKEGVPYKWRDINADYWVMGTSLSVDSNGLRQDLEISNIDRYETDAAGILVGAIDAINVQNVNVQPYPVIFPWGPFQQPIDTLTPVEFQFPIFNNALRLNSVKMYLIRDVWTAVAGTAIGGGDHRHVMFDGLISSVDRAINRIAACRDSLGVGITVGFYYNSSSTETVLYTQGSSGTHTHDTEFNKVKKDTLVPVGVSVVVNSMMASSGLFPTSGGSNIEEIDITNEVLGKSGGFRGWHSVTINTSSNRGDISAVFLVDVDISKVRV